MLTAIRGNASESAVLHAFIKRGFHVLMPFGDGCPFDLAVALPNACIVRVQVKTGWPRSTGCISFNTHSTDHGRGPGSYVGLADFFGVYSADVDAVYLVPVDLVGHSECKLRIEPTRNNQRRRVNMADDFLIDLWTADAMHEVVERHAHSQSSSEAAA